MLVKILKKCNLNYENDNRPGTPCTVLPTLMRVWGKVKVVLSREMCVPLRSSSVSVVSSNSLHSLHDKGGRWEDRKVPSPKTPNPGSECKMHLLRKTGQPRSSQHREKAEAVFIFCPARALRNEQQPRQFVSSLQLSLARPSKLGLHIN